MDLSKSTLWLSLPFCTLDVGRLLTCESESENRIARLVKSTRVDEVSFQHCSPAQRLRFTQASVTLAQKSDLNIKIESTRAKSSRSWSNNTRKMYCYFLLRMLHSFFTFIFETELASFLICSVQYKSEKENLITKDTFANIFFSCCIKTKHWKKNFHRNTMKTSGSSSKVNCWIAWVKISQSQFLPGVNIW